MREPAFINPFHWEFGASASGTPPNPTVSIIFRHCMHFFDFFVRSDECSRAVRAVHGAPGSGVGTCGSARVFAPIQI